MIAYMDESYEIGPAGVYVLAAVLCEEGDAEVRQATLDLREPCRRQWKLNFHDADTKRVPIYLDTVRSLGRPVVVVVARPCPKPERARRKALERLLWVLRGRVHGLVIEHRTTELDRADRVILASVCRREGRRLDYRFPLGKEEPILWAADIVASAVYRGYARGEEWMPESLGALETHELDVD
jgi:hypothetical protein